MLYSGNPMPVGVSRVEAAQDRLPIHGDHPLWDKALPPTKLPIVYFELSVQNPKEEKLNPLGQIVMELRSVTGIGLPENSMSCLAFYR